MQEIFSGTVVRKKIVIFRPVNSKQPMSRFLVTISLGSSMLYQSNNIIHVMCILCAHAHTNI